jgi:hypothetical protein
MAKLELTDDIEIEKYKRFCQFEQQLLAEDARWQQLKKYCKDVGHGTISLAIQDGMPYKISKPMQTVILGIKI